MYVCIYIYMYNTHVDTHIYLYIYIYMHTCRCIYVHIIDAYDDIVVGRGEVREKNLGRSLNQTIKRTCSNPEPCSSNQRHWSTHASVRRVVGFVAAELEHGAAEFDEADDELHANHIISMV